MGQSKAQNGDRLLAQTRRAFAAGFPEAKVDVYRYNPACIRVRVVDESFRGLSIQQREEVAESVLRKLPKNARSEITVLLLLPREEMSQSLMNLEFERPTVSRL
jgi:hypothetical protein